MKQVISLILLFGLLCQLSLNAQEIINFSRLESIDSTVLQFSESIRADDLEKHLNILASDGYQGRETGSEGQKKAARYIGDYFDRLGLEGLGEEERFQSFPLVTQSWKEVFVVNGTDTFRFLEDFYCYPGSNKKALNLEKDAFLFIGYGIDDERYSDYRGVDAKGKILLALDEEPVRNGQSIITGNEELSDWSEDWKAKITAAKEKEASLLMIIDEYVDFRMNSEPFVNYLSSPSMKLKGEEEPAKYLNNLYISPEMADQLMGKKNKKINRKTKKIAKKGKPASMMIEADMEVVISQQIEEIVSENILGFIRGSQWPEEVIIITSHYDHLGMEGNDIYNGADDDGSGTVALMEIAEACMKAKEAGYGPKRSILFMPVSGEEKGLLGSEFYADNPLIPLENTVANINIDMVGRVDEEHEDDEDYVYVIGSDFLSTGLHQISEAVAAQHSPIELDYRFNSTDDPNRFYYRSDHYNFAKNNIPVIFYFNGTHEDYHQPSDTPDKIRFDVLEKRSQLIFLTLWELANRKDRIFVDVE